MTAEHADMDMVRVPVSLMIADCKFHFAASSRKAEADPSVYEKPCTLYSP